jgi:hypothetical protein
MTSMPLLNFSKQRPLGRRSPRLTLIAAYALVCLVWAASALGETIAYDTPEWRKEIAHGFLPYHRLARADFPIDDKAHANYAMYTYGFFHYNYEPKCTKDGDHVIARITEWRVRSGFNRNKSSRKSWFKDVERLVIHEQGHLDINELHSRHLAHMKLEQLPVGEGTTSAEALDDLRSKVTELSNKTSKEDQTEQDAYDAETSHGTNRSKQVAATAAIQKRLKADGITYTNESDDDQTGPTQERQSPFELLGRTLKKDR